MACNYLMVFFVATCVQPKVSSTYASDTSVNISNFKIYGGHKISIKSAPFMAALIIPKKDGDTYFCGGSIIHKKFILSAAHCFRDSAVPFSASGYVGMSNLKDPSKVRIKLKTTFCHEEFTDYPSKNDICILKLAKPLEFGLKVNKVMLPKEDLVTPAGALVKVTGWGDTERSHNVENLRQVTVRITDKGCRGGDRSFICAGSEGKGACHGDSGGPLTYNGEQIGVVSVNPEEGCTSESGDIYTRVAHYSKWISNIIRKNENV